MYNLIVCFGLERSKIRLEDWRVIKCTRKVVSIRSTSCLEGFHSFLSFGCVHTWMINKCKPAIMDLFYTPSNGLQHIATHIPTHGNLGGYLIWLLVLTILKNIKVNMGRIIPNWMESHNIQVPNHQPDILLFQLLTIINHRLTIDLPIYHENMFQTTNRCHFQTHEPVLKKPKLRPAEWFTSKTHP